MPPSATVPDAFSLCTVLVTLALTLLLAAAAPTQPQAATVRVSVANVWQAPNAGHLPLDPHVWPTTALTVTERRALVGHMPTQALYGERVLVLGSPARLDEDRDPGSAVAARPRAATRAGSAAGSSVRPSRRLSSSRRSTPASRTAPKSGSARRFPRARSRRRPPAGCRARVPTSCARPGSSSASTTCGAGSRRGATTAPG